MTKRHAIAVAAVALLLSPVLLAVGTLVVIPLLLIAAAMAPFVGIAALTGMITFASREIEATPSGPSASLMTGVPA